VEYLLNQVDACYLRSTVFPAQSADAASTKRVLVAIVQLCYDTQDWEALNENIMILTKRRGQLKMAIQAMVEQCSKFIDETPDRDTKLKLVNTLRTATEGKIYVEVERARLTMELARMRESEGDVVEAAKVLQELQVETFGSMKREEKVEFILEQMRLGLAKKDYIRTQIISKKVSTKFFADSGSHEVQQLKLKFYQLMIELGLNSDDFLEISRHYFAIYETPCVQEDQDRKKQTLCNVILYCLLAPFDNEQSDMLHRLKKEKLLEDLPMYRDVVQMFVTQELVDWKQFELTFGSTLRDGTTGEVCTGVFRDKPQYWEELRKRVIEHVSLCLSSCCSIGLTLVVLFPLRIFVLLPNTTPKLGYSGYQNS
jgi:26S proteasome regulatory subunit N5